MKYILIFTFFSILLIAQKPRNLIFIIGDGMSFAQVSAYHNTNGYKSNFQKFTHTGIIETSSKTHKITDSGAGATVYSIGEKTHNRAIGVSSYSSRKENILESLSKKGYKTGIVSTSSITHATPASFYAHVPHRNQEEDIAEQMLDAPVDYFAGGGIQFFTKREDKRDIVKELEKIGFVMQVGEKFDPVYDKPKQGYLLADVGMEKAPERGDFLMRAGLHAIDQLLPSDFFLMIEGSQIDWAGHANDSTWLYNEMADFDQMLAEILAFAEKDGETLVIVTADHETGGLSLASDNKDYNHVLFNYSTGKHTSVAVPIFAFGPGAEKFTGFYSNEKVYWKLKEIFDF